MIHGKRGLQLCRSSTLQTGRITGDPERFPCHFDYKIGDSFTYDGEKFEGRICNSLLKNMAVIWDTMFYGHSDYNRMLYLYSGLSAGTCHEKYDGIGFRPQKVRPKGANPRH